MSERYRSLNLEFAVIGAQRGGSTFLASLIDHVPGIDLPYLELPIFEDPFFETADLHEISRAFKTDRRALRGIKRPDLLGKPELADRLLHAGVSRFIVSLRNPVDRLVSAVHWYMYVGLIELEPPEVILEGLLSTAQQGNLEGRYADLVNYSLYGQQLDAWSSKVGLENLFVVTNRAVRQDSHSVQHETLSFLGLEMPSQYSAPAAKDLVRNANYYGQRRLKILRARLPFAASWDSVDGFALNAKGTAIRTSKTRRSAVLAVHAVDRAASLGSKQSGFSIGPEARLAWAAFFENDIQRVRKLLPDLDLSDW